MNAESKILDTRFESVMAEEAQIIFDNIRINLSYVILRSIDDRWKNSTGYSICESLLWEAKDPLEVFYSRNGWPFWALV